MTKSFYQRERRKLSRYEVGLRIIPFFWVVLLVFTTFCGCGDDKSNELSSSDVERAEKNVSDAHNDDSSSLAELPKSNVSDAPNDDSSSLAELLAQSLDDESDKDSSDDAEISNAPNASPYAERDEPRKAPQGLRVVIERCVDGDTLIVRYGQERERVRLIGVNTPETVKKDWPVEPYGPEASAYTKRRVEETGSVATLVSDGDLYDKYDRKLAFIYLGDETISLNEDLARQGLGKVELFYNFSQTMKDRLRDCADLAKSEKLGIYSGDADVGKKPEAPVEFSASVQGERVRIERVLNADTLILQGGVKLQLNGINAPEDGERYGSEATAYVRSRVASVGGVATLVSDGDPYDRYGRKLAFVYLGSETISLNEDLAR